MIIRAFQTEDFPRLLILADQMKQESPQFRSLDMTNEKLIELGDTIIKRPDIMCGLVAIDTSLPQDSAASLTGFIMAVLSEHWFGRQKIASDLGLFVTPDARGGKAAIALIKGYEKWAWHHGCAEISLGITTGVHTLRTLTLYEKLGFPQVGVLCKKRKGD